MAEIKTDSQIKKVIKDSVLLEGDKKTYFSISGYQEAVRLTFNIDILIQLLKNVKK